MEREGQPRIHQQTLPLDRVMRVEGYDGHGGQTFGFESYVAANPDNNTTINVGTNDAMVRSMDLFMGQQVSLCSAKV